MFDNDLVVGTAAGLIVALLLYVFRLVVGFLVSLSWWKRLLGDSWMSRYQSIDDPANKWYEETLQIVPRFPQGLVLKSRNNVEGYTYDAFAKLSGCTYLHGRWKSRRHKDIGGYFCLTVYRDFLAGYWGGINDRTGARGFGKWLIAKNTAGLEAAHRMLDPTLEHGSGNGETTADTVATNG